MTRQLGVLGMPFERIEAVDGRSLSPREVARHLRAFKWWCAKGYAARNGEVGCALSHQLAYRKILSDGVAEACILEDDVSPGSMFAAMLDAVADFMSASPAPRVVILTPYSGRGSAKDDGISFECTDWAASTGAYALNAAAAEHLLAVNDPLQSTADDWWRWAKRGGIELYKAWPVVCAQDAYAQQPADPAFASDTIDEGTVFAKDMPPLRRALHMLGRVVGRSIDAITR